MMRTIERIFPSDSLFPKLLSEIPDVPNVLYYIGELPSPLQPAVSIVGTRKASLDGIRLARGIAEELASAGFAIVSGLAFGIDAAAHEGALRAKGRTYAVLANGLGSIYPREHEQLAEHILSSSGGLVSEYEPDSPAFKHQFLARNRIISGLCIASILIEVPARSGALATARYAAEQGREVYVFPGASTNSRYAGSHGLIRNGARLVTSVKDILEDLEQTLPQYEQFRSFLSPSQEMLPFQYGTLDDNQIIVAQVLRSAVSPLSIDKIQELTTLQSHVVSQTLTVLMLQGIIEEGTAGFRLKLN